MAENGYGSPGLIAWEKRHDKPIQLKDRQEFGNFQF
jgi:hypothetical protein